MNDAQKKVFQSLADNRALFEATKEFLLEKFDLRTIQAEGTNEYLGMVARAKLEGRKAIDQAFDEIALCRTVEPYPQRINEAS